MSVQTEQNVLSVLLIAALAVPLLGALATVLPIRVGRWWGSAVSGVVLLAVIATAVVFDYDRPGVQGEVDVAWIPTLNIHFHLGVDGISLPLLGLTALLSFLCALYTDSRPPAANARAFTGLLLALEVGMLGTFTALDMLLFFLAFETVLIPMYFLIARWGGPDGRGGGDARPAATRFILYTVLGSAVMLVGILLLGQAGPGQGYDMTASAERSSGAYLAVLLVLIGLAVKVPAWPLHSWLPDAHTAAPTVGSVLLAGVLLKMGTYGIVRIVLPMPARDVEALAPYLAAFGTVGVLYGSLVCLAMVTSRQGTDLKRLIAYSSIGHMGFVLLGVSTLTPVGVNAALFANIAHGLITGLLFFLVGAMKQRYGSTDLEVIAGARGGSLYGRAPRLGGLLAFGAVAGLGLPGLAGFWGEMLALFAAFDPAAALDRSTYLVLMAAAGFGTLLTAAYLLLMVRRVCMGPGAEAEPDGSPVRPTDASFADASRLELTVWSPLVALTVLAGLWPAVLLGLTEPSVTYRLFGG